MTLSINVPDGSTMANDISGWQDGADYELTVTQTAPGAFELKSAEPAEPEDTGEGGGMEMGEGMDKGMMESKPAHKNPAIAIVISRGSKGRA